MNGRTVQTMGQIRTTTTHTHYELLCADGTPYGAMDAADVAGALRFEGLDAVRAEILEAARTRDVPGVDPCADLVLVEVVEQRRPLAGGDALRRLLARRDERSTARRRELIRSYAGVAPSLTQAAAGREGAARRLERGAPRNARRATR